MPCFTSDNIATLKPIVQEIINERYTELNNVEEITDQCIALLDSLPLFSNPIFQLKDFVFDSLPDSKELLKNLLSANLFTYSSNTLKLKNNASSRILPIACSIAHKCIFILAKKQQVLSSETSKLLANYLIENHPIPPSYLLEREDIALALLQLAIANEHVQSEILNCSIIDFNGANLTEKQNTIRLTNNLHNIHFFPAYMFINTGSHWTWLKITKEHDDSYKATYLDPLPDPEEGAKSAFTPLIMQSLNNAFNDDVAFEYSNGNQRDNWSCGYHVLADIAHDLKILEPKPDNVHELQNWFIKLAIGKSLDEHNQATMHPLLDAAMLNCDRQNLTEREFTQLDNAIRRITASINTLLPNSLLKTALEKPNNISQVQGLLSRLIPAAVKDFPNNLELKDDPYPYIENQIIAEAIALEKQNDRTGFNAMSKKGNAAFSSNTPLTASDVKIGLYSLMLKEPFKRDRLSNHQVCANMDELENALLKGKDFRAFPQHIMVNVDNEWFYLKHTSNADQRTFQLVSPYVTENLTKDPAKQQQLVALKNSLQEKLTRVYEGEAFKVSELFCDQSFHYDDNKWSSGYLALANAARLENIELNLNLQLSTKEKAERERTLQKWALNLITNTQAPIIAQAQRKAGDATQKKQTSEKKTITSKLPTESLKHNAKQATSSTDASIASTTTAPKNAFAAEQRQWLSNTLFKEFNWTAVNFEESKQRFVISPSTSQKDGEKLEVSITTHQVSAKNSMSLTEDEREELAEQMVKIFIANELKLKDGQDFPSIEEIKRSNLKMLSLTGKCEKLKGLIKAKLPEYGITLLNSPTTTKASSANTIENTTSRMKEKIVDDDSLDLKEPNSTETEHSSALKF